MAVKIEQINDLEELGSKIKQYSSSMTSASSSAQTTFSAKLEGSAADSVNQFVGVMNQLKSDAFAKLPEATTNFAQALQNYHSALKGAGFDNLIKSTKPVVEEDYCQKVTNTEFQTFEEKANDIKSVITEIAGVLPEVPDSKVETLLNTLHTDLQGKTNEIKNTRSTVQQAQTAFKSKLEEVASELAQCLTSIENTMNLTDPKSGLKPANMIKLISQGFGNAIVSGKMNKKDVEALNYLGEGEYDKLFKLDPNQLSDQLHGVLTNKVIDQVTLGEDAPADLEKFLNALLSQTGDGAQARVAKYLEKFSEQTALQFAQINVLLSLDSSDPALIARFDKTRVANDLFETLFLINPVNRKLEDVPGGQLWANYYGVLQKLKFAKDGAVTFTFDEMKRYSGFDQYSLNVDKAISVSSQRVDSTKFNNAESQQKLADLRKKKADFVSNTIKQCLTDGTMIGLGIFAPEVAGTLAIVQSILLATDGFKQAGNLNNAFDKGILEYQKNKFGNDTEGFKNWKKQFDSSKGTAWRNGAGNALSTASELIASWNQLTNDLEDAKLENIYNILDIGGLTIDKNNDTKFTVPTPVDKMTYDELNRYIDFTENGYQRYFNTLDKNTSKTIQENLEEQLVSNKISKELYNFILNGKNLNNVEDVDRMENALRNAIRSGNFQDETELVNKMYECFKAR